MLFLCDEVQLAVQCFREGGEELEDISSSDLAAPSVLTVPLIPGSRAHDWRLQCRRRSHADAQ